jgi:hypothetical protein
LGDHSIHINSVELLQLEEPILVDNAGLSIKIDYTSQYDYDQLIFRMIIFSNQQLPVGMVLTNSDITARKGNNKIQLDFDLSALAPGEYSGRIVFYEVNDYGGESIHDVVDQAFAFQKVVKESLNGTVVTWKERVWGNVYFPAAKHKELGE